MTLEDLENCKCDVIFASPKSLLDGHYHRFLLIKLPPPSTTPNPYQKKKNTHTHTKKKTKKTRAGVCKTLCPQLPDSNTVWLQHCLAMTVTTVQIYDFNVILSKGNNSKIGDDWDKKKIRITYFFMRNQNMKFQNISIHGSKLMLYTIKQRH